MNAKKLIINGHFRPQQVTGVQRYAWEILSQFDEQHISYDWLQPPRKLQSDTLRQLWMQSVMPLKVPDNAVLWSPTNIGPVFCESQIITLHDIAGQLHPQWFDDKYIAWRRFILPKLLKRVRGIITVSEFSRKTIVEKFPQAEGKIEVIYNGVCTEHFYPRQVEEVKQLRNNFNLGKPFVLSVGSLDSRKNIAGLLKAWHLLPARLRNQMNLVITGESARKFAFTLEEKHDESVIFTGYIQEKQLPVLYSAAQIFVYPSFFEGFGLPVLEAMACGTPVITSNNTALAEIAGPAAVVVNPHAIDEIRDAMESLLEAPSQQSQMVADGLKWAGQFTWKQCADKTYNYIVNKAQCD